MCWKWKSLSCARLFAAPRTIQSVEFSRPEYWSGQSFPSPGVLPHPGIKPRSPTLQANSLPAEPPGKSKNTGVGHRILLQRILLTGMSNRGLPHRRRILYQLSYRETPLHSYPQILAFCSKRRGRNNKRHSMDFYREFAKQIVPFFVEMMQFRFSLSLLDLPQWEHLVSACSVLDNLLVT